MHIFAYILTLATIYKDTDMAEYNLTALAQETARQKLNLVKKFLNQHGKNEVPREVFLNVCETIAQYYEPLGFKWYKSTPKIELKKGEFVFNINFHSSRYNIADEYVEISVGAGVSSSKLKKWEKASPYKMFNNLPKGHLGGGQIGNLQENHTWLEWNVASPDTREETVNDIIQHINTLALPFFDTFTFVTEGEHYGIRRTTFLLYFFTKHDLEKSMSSFLTKRNFWDKYETVLRLLKENKEIDRKNSGTFWHDIAEEVLELGLTLDKNCG